MNPKQRLILRRLVATNGLRYSDLFKYFTYEDKLPYHLKFLVEKGLISKENNKYYLTADGMSASGNFDTHTLEEIETPRTLLLFIVKHGDKYFLNNHFSRDKNPTRQIYFLPFAMPPVGQPLDKSAHQEFLRKYHIATDFKYALTLHEINKTSAGKLLFDTVWLVYQSNIQELHYTFAPTSGEEWFTKQEIGKLKNIHPMLKSLLLEEYNRSFIDQTITLDYGLEKSEPRI